MQARTALSRRTFLRMGAAGTLIGLAGAAIGAEYLPVAAPTPASLPLQATGGGADTAVLLVINQHHTNPFGQYFAEILAAEGVLAFHTQNLTALDSDQLLRYPLAILTEGSLSADQVALFEGYVAGGGVLVAMHPDPQLARVLGIAFSGGEFDGQFLVPANHPVAAGIAAPLQIHGPVQTVTLQGADAIAWHKPGTGPATTQPLIGQYRYGTGLSVFWAFDLARSIVLTRQGNPTSADQEHDDLEGIRASDMFVGWVDPEHLTYPFADELQRLLIAIVEQASRVPILRLWYLPGMANTALIVTGDAHGSYTSHINEVLGLVERAGGTMSIYYSPPLNGALRRIPRKLRWWLGNLFELQEPHPGPYQVARWRERGHEFGMHPYVEQGLEQGYARYWAEFVKLGYGEHTPTVRTHRVLWYGWVQNAAIQSAYGMRMNLDHYHIGSAVRFADGTPVFGYLTGSGLPLRFVDQTGSILPVFQQHTHLVDEHLMDVFGSGKDLGMTAEAATAVTTAQLQASLGGAPAALGMQCHVDPFTLGGAIKQRVAGWFAATLGYAAEHQIPILSAERWLSFVEARRQVTLSESNWSPETNRLDWQLTVPHDTPGSLQLMIPSHYQGRILAQVLLDGTPAQLVEQPVRSQRHCMLALPSGNHRIQVQYAD